MYTPVHLSISIQKWSGRGYTIQDMLSLFTDSSGEILVIPSFNDLVTTLLNNGSQYIIYRPSVRCAPPRGQIIQAITIYNHVMSLWSVREGRELKDIT